MGIDLENLHAFVLSLAHGMSLNTPFTVYNMHVYSVHLWADIAVRWQSAN